MQNTDTIDDYIARAPGAFWEKLRRLRDIIRETAPEAKERISYGMPYFDYKGRLAYFALMKNHIGLYIPPPIIEQHKNDLKDYKTTKSAVHLPLETDLPVSLIEKLVKARIKWNEKHAV